MPPVAWRRSSYSLNLSLDIFGVGGNTKIAESNISTPESITSRTLGSRCAPPLAALRAAHALDHISEPRVPSGDVGEGARVAAAGLAAGALDEDQVLVEFVAELFDLQVAHGPDCTSIQVEFKLRICGRMRVSKASASGTRRLGQRRSHG
jgi:hypothetical protein